MLWFLCKVRFWSNTEHILYSYSIVRECITACWVFIDTTFSCTVQSSGRSLRNDIFWLRWKHWFSFFAVIFIMYLPYLRIVCNIDICFECKNKITSSLCILWFVREWAAIRLCCARTDDSCTGRAWLEYVSRTRCIILRTPWKWRCFVCT